MKDEMKYQSKVIPLRGYDHPKFKWINSSQTDIRRTWRMEPLMKAVLEFQYPEDEYKLEHALKGTQYYNALCEIDIILAAPYTKADAYGRIKKVILEVLGDT
jgi:hypothetical protein